jgi:hypothetical protein
MVAVLALEQAEDVHASASSRTVGIDVVNGASVLCAADVERDL